MSVSYTDIFQPLIAGALIGLSSSIMLGFLGRITGISGILSSVLALPKKEHWWRYAFIFGLLLGGKLLHVFTPQFFLYNFDFQIGQTVIAGLLVGFGTTYACGCTSGHGICGLPRFSKRSLVATLTFIGAGIITVFIKGKF